MKQGQRHDFDQDVVSIPATGDSTSSSDARKDRKAASDPASVTDDDSSNLTASRLQEHLLRAAHCAEDLQSKSEALVAENQKLMELLRQNRTSALDWCSVAKSYMQDRNFMAIKLAELESRIAEISRNKAKDRQSAVSKSEDGQRDISPTSGTAGMASALASSSKAAVESEAASTLDSFISQSISQILDQVYVCAIHRAFIEISVTCTNVPYVLNLSSVSSKATREPTLPPLSKGKYTVGTASTDTVNKNKDSTPGLRSVLKSSTRTSDCKCGCQEELRAWRSRCAFAENQVTLAEMRYEKITIVLEGYKAKWGQWKERIVREQYHRRMKAAMPPQAVRYMTLGVHPSSQKDHHSPQRRHNQQNSRSELPGHPERDVRRARIDTEESDNSQLRRETERNTMFNQLNSRLLRTEVVSGSSVMFDGLPGGTGSMSEPHVIIDDLNVNTNHQESDEVSASSRQDDASNFFGSLPMSPTFPSDIALIRRRQTDTALDDEDDFDDSSNDISGYGVHETDVKPLGHDDYHSVSPATRALEVRNLRRTPNHTNSEGSTRQQQQQQDISAEDNADISEDLSVRSDRSSPSIFDSVDFMTTLVRRLSAGNAGTSLRTTKDNSGMIVRDAAAIAVTPRWPGKEQLLKPSNGSGSIAIRSTGVGAPSTGTSPRSNVGRVLVPETPIELQGVTPKRIGPNGHIPIALATPDVGRSMIGSAEDIIVLDHDELAHSQPLSDYPNKENEEPHRDAGTDNGEDEDDWEHQQDLDLADDRKQHQLQHQRLRLPATESNDPEQRVYNFTERRKDKRKQMHGHDCPCCRRFYELTGPLPLPDGYNAFFTPAPRPGDKEVWDRSGDERLQDRIQQISRHRIHHETPLTPPGFWDTHFPPTPDRVEWDRIAGERRDRKKQRVVQADQQLQRQRQQNERLQQRQQDQRGQQEPNEPQNKQP
ncbi:hypothetical protein BGZ99_004725 [Dissophora globulifera]|uniref:DNA endonuclease activator Ctp1 C-terminal domain-containing protein n=1 Tax=Dissophora globulifera TaxID=979702 RepID=A0A9P6RH34_9FUNG|nr:hypothetical protein BGZ99_004725 [Dissophora globulifera]